MAHAPHKGESQIPREEGPDQAPRSCGATRRRRDGRRPKEFRSATGKRAKLDFYDLHVPPYATAGGHPTEREPERSWQYCVVLSSLAVRLRTTLEAVEPTAERQGPCVRHAGH